MPIKSELRDMARAMLLTAATGLTLAHAQGSACEPIRLSIEEKIRGNGVTSFKVLVVDASAEIKGRVVGNCEAGAKKLVYVQGVPPEGSAATAAPAASQATKAKPRRPAIITECFDGKIYRDGPCKK